MAIEIVETLRVEAPIERVWQFVMDPQRVVTCMPGATLDEIVDDSHFLGTVKIKVGAISASYKGKVEYADVDAQAHSIRLVAEGRETGGGTAKGTIAMALSGSAAGPTELAITANIDLTGRIMQVGRGMIQGVSHQLFKQFAASTKAILETEGEESKAAAAVVADQQELALLPLLIRTIAVAIGNFFRRLFGRSSG